MAVFYDNQALYRICENNLDIEQPNYINNNEVIAQSISSFTAPLRFRGSINTTIQQCMTNLIPYPRIKYMISSMSPLSPAEQALKRTPELRELTSRCFDVGNMMASCDSPGKFMSLLLMFGGNPTYFQVKESIYELLLSQKVSFFDWSPERIKVAINEKSIYSPPKNSIAKTTQSCCMFSNVEEMGEIFEKISSKFDHLYCKPAFLFWYIGEGMEYEEFSNAW